jgi:hypothetical protein
MPDNQGLSIVPRRIMPCVNVDGRRTPMRRIFVLIALLALVVVFAMPVVTADAAHHEKNPCQTKEMMKKSGDETKQEVNNPCKANPCSAKTANPCSASGKPMNPCDAKTKTK